MSINKKVDLSLPSLLYLAFTHICNTAFSSLANIPQKIREIGASLRDRIFPATPAKTTVVNCMNGPTIYGGDKEVRTFIYSTPKQFDDETSDARY